MFVFKTPDSFDLSFYPKLLQNSTNIFLLNFPSFKTSLLMTDIASNGFFALRYDFSLKDRYSRLFESRSGRFLNRFFE